MPHLPRAIRILRGQVDGLRELVHQELCLAEIGVQEGVGSLQIHIRMILVPREGEALGAHCLIVIRLYQFSRFGFQCDGWIEAVDVLHVRA